MAVEGAGTRGPGQGWGLFLKAVGPGSSKPTGLDPLRTHRPTPITLEPEC